MRRSFFVANWKMNLGRAQGRAYLSEFAPFAAKTKTVDIGLAPQMPEIGEFSEVLSRLGSGIQLTSQNCGTAKSGAFTGEASPEVLREYSVSWVILGHSERRHVFHEDNSLVSGRLKAALEAGLGAILCVGETLKERKEGEAKARVSEQLSVLKDLRGFISPTNLVIAYEPVWAIGTGETATPEQAQEMHLAIRSWLRTQLGTDLADSTRIQYGGSVKPDNAAKLMKQPDIDGFLVGGASLTPSGFAEIIRLAVESRS